MALFNVLLDEELRDFQREMIRQLSERPMDFIKFAKAVQANVESVGSESQAKRERLKQLIEFAQHHFRNELREQLLQRGVSPEPKLQSNKRCLEAKEHVDRMVAPAALIEAWSADLAAI